MMKGQKGITLVALIITIIVMLILVAVSISVAMDGGLFTRARGASRQTKQAQVAEAVALAKAELLSDFYSKKTNVERTVPTEGYIENLIQGYLDEKDIKDIKATKDETKNIWTISTPDVDYEGDEKEPELDLSKLDYATSNSGTGSSTGSDTTGSDTTGTEGE